MDDHDINDTNGDEPDLTVSFEEAMQMGKRSFERLPVWRQEAVSTYIDSAQHLQPDETATA